MTLGVIGVIGRGRAARSLVPLLELAGHAPGWWWSRGDPGRLGELPPADVILLAVSDGAIQAVASELAARPSATTETWLHLSGSLPGELCRVDGDRPAAAGCLHPLQALPGTPVPRSHLAGATAGLDGDPAAVDVARTLALALGMTPRTLAPGSKALYHAAAVTVAGHATALFAQGMQMLVACGFEPDEARAALQPLMAGAVANLADGAPQDVITGPLARGDHGTLARHLEALDALAPDLGATYRRLAATAVELSRDQLDQASVEAIRRALAAR